MILVESPEELREYYADLVDLGFVKRDRAGTRYFLNYPKLEATLSQEAMRSASELPLPEFDPAQIEAIDDSLEYPDRGAVARCGQT